MTLRIGFLRMFLIFIFFSPGATAQTILEDAQGLLAFLEKRYVLAFNHLQSPRLKAHVAYRMGRYEQALALWSHDDDADAHYNRGNALAHLGLWSQAAAAYQSALERDPRHQDARHNLHEISRFLKDSVQSLHHNVVLTFEPLDLSGSEPHNLLHALILEEYSKKEKKS